MTEAYEGYRFNVVYRNLYDYVTELSNGYLNATKDRVYCGQVDGHDRRSALTVWAQILSMLVHDLQPILCFHLRRGYGVSAGVKRDGQTRAALLDWFEAPWSAEEALRAAFRLQPARNGARPDFTKAFEEAKEAGIVTEGTSQAAFATLTLPADAGHCIGRRRPCRGLRLRGGGSRLGRGLLLHCCPREGREVPALLERARARW